MSRRPSPTSDRRVTNHRDASPIGGGIRSGAPVAWIAFHHSSPVLAVEEPTLLRYDWRNKESDRSSIVTMRLEPVPGGTRVTFDHTGFHGIEGVFMSRLFTRVRRKMLAEGLPAVLNDLDEHGQLKPGSQLRSKRLRAHSPASAMRFALPLRAGCLA